MKKKGTNIKWIVWNEDHSFVYKTKKEAVEDLRSFNKDMPRFWQEKYYLFKRTTL